ncbi:MAG: thiamine phosphate synthase [Candidatus Eremiobacteraeota bacterium]|nr:thiamine phosphate synthase [Candidatus Eremiobacteraeota bacterium]
MSRSELAARLYGIYAIVDARPGVVGLAGELLAGGIKILQYRAKRGIVPDDLRQIRAMTKEHSAVLIVNDHWRAVEEFDADGVHLGPDDASADDVRNIRVALRDRLIGLSCGTEEEARIAQAVGADYIGIGAVYATGSKADAGSPIGAGELQRIASAVTLPAAAIGGINALRLLAIRESGVAMAAMISVFRDSKNPRATAGQLVALWNHP